MKRFLWFPVVLSIFSLGGCYEADAPVLDGGDRAPLVDSFQCELRDKEFNVAYHEQRGAPPLFLGDSESYWYANDSGTPLQTKRIADDLFVVQMPNKDPKDGVVLLFYEFVPGGFLILEERHPEVETLAARHNVSLTRGDSAWEFKIAGNHANLLAFLIDHREESLTVTGRCNGGN
jgi:hypothetical protein